MSRDKTTPAPPHHGVFEELVEAEHAFLDAGGALSLSVVFHLMKANIVVLKPSQDRVRVVVETGPPFFFFFQARCGKDGSTAFKFDVPQQAGPPPASRWL